MKIAAFFFLLLSTIIIQCSKENKGQPGCDQLMKARVIRISCASLVIQLLDNRSLGEDNWINGFDGKKYDDVITVANPCALSKNLSQGQIIYVGLVAGNDQPYCATCKMNDYPPQKFFTVCDLK